MGIKNNLNTLSMQPKGSAMSLLINIDGQSRQPVFRQIIDQIIAFIDAGALKTGARLPSTRLLADKLGVNRSTVYKAYQELWSLGYLESKPGSYSTVRNRPKVVTQQRKPDESLIHWQERITPISEDLYRASLKEQAVVRKIAPSDAVNFIPLSPDSRLFPMDAFRKCMNHVLIGEGVDLLQYGSPLGYGPLREYIADRMRLHSVSVTADEIMITTGAQNAIELLLKMLAAPGSVVAFETPTYSRAIDIFKLGGVKMLGIPMNKNGMDLDALEHLIKKESPALVYTITNFHNPTGITTGQSHRERLLRICERRRIPLVEDGFEEEMKYFGKAVLPVKSMDHHGVVIYLGTFSKILFPGLRIGWIAAEQACIDRLVPIQRTLILSGNLLDQAALDRFCRLGHYDLHVKRMHRIYRKRMLSALSAADKYLPKKHVSWTTPAGGYTIWIRVKGLSMTEEDVTGHILSDGVMALPGSSHFYGSSDGLYFRLSIAHLDETEIEEGIRRLGKSFDRLYGKRGGQ
jgi:DNA-binding transcriptional MocR family regulator